MHRFFTKLKSALTLQSSRDRYMMEAVDLADLEHRQKLWDRMELDRHRYFQYRNF